MLALVLAAMLVGACVTASSPAPTSSSMLSRIATSAPRASSSCSSIAPMPRRAPASPRTEHGSIAPASATAMPAPSSPGAVPIRRPVRSHEEAAAVQARQDARDVARALADTPAFERSRHRRKKVEMLFAHLKRILRLGRLRLRGPSGARDEFLLAATAQNLRKLAKLRPMTVLA